jgi:hypothetical protein
MKENPIADGALVLGTFSVATFYDFIKWLFSSETMAKAAVMLAIVLSLLRIIDWCVRRYRYGWKPNDETDFRKD